MMKTSYAWIRAHHSEFPFASRWIHEPEFDDILIRANVDADYMPNVWLGSFIFKDVFAASSFGILNPFSTLFHHINMTQKGRYWDYDGYSFSGSSRRGRDLFPMIPSVFLDTRRSSPIGGQSPLNGMYLTDIGAYKQGFKGTEQEWQKLYGNSPALSSVTFPPAYVPAELAWQQVLKSPRSQTAVYRQWQDEIPTIGLEGTSFPSRLYWRREIPGLPQDLELLGLAIHLVQDMVVPQHVRATADLCHVELEEVFDELACEGTGIPDEWIKAQKEFVLGTYDTQGALPECQALADPDLIRKKLGAYSFLRPNTAHTAGEMALLVAQESSQWTFGKTWLGPFWTRLPSGQTIKGNSCLQIVSRPEVAQEIREKYALAVAVTVRMLELAARSYELHRY